MQFDVVMLINMLGLMAFAFVGAMKAIREQMDLLGILVLGIVTAFGGGIIRDVIINKIPYAFSAVFDVSVATLGVLAAGLIYKALEKDLSGSYYILMLDALGLAAFTATGALTAYNAGVTGFGLVFLAAVTAVGGGAVGDLLLGRVPSILKDDCYATCSLVGGAVFYFAALLGADMVKSSLLCSAVTLLIRTLAIHGRWNLPKLA